MFFTSFSTIINYRWNLAFLEYLRRLIPCNTCEDEGTFGLVLCVFNTFQEETTKFVGILTHLPTSPNLVQFKIREMPMNDFLKFYIIV